MPALPALPAFVPGQSLTLGQIPFAAQADCLTALLRHAQRPIVHVAINDKDALALQALLRFLSPNTDSYYLPAWDTLPYDRVSPANGILSQRLATLGALATRNLPAPYVLFTTLNAISQKLPPRSLIGAAQFTITRGSTLKHEAMTQFLVHHGYHRASKVMEPGEFAIRGSLIDIFPAGADNALRIDMFGDEIESIRRFDPLTQLSAESVESYVLRPVSEVLLNHDSIARFRSQYRELFGAVIKEDPLYTSISEGRAYAGMEHWLPLFYEQLDHLTDYTPNALITEDYRVAALHDERTADIADYYDARVKHAQTKHAAPYHPIPPNLLFQTSNQLAEHWHHHTRITFSPFVQAEGLAAQYRAAPVLRDASSTDHPVESVKSYLQQATTRVVLAAASLGSAERIRNMLALESLPLHASLEQAAEDPVSITILPIEQGYTTAEYTLITEQDMFGERIIRTTKKKRKAEAFMQEAASFLAGELVVHREHGIGRFEELVTVEVNATKHDCLKLIYEGGDKLFLPVENIDLISRYGSNTEGVVLDKLGGVAWQKRKSALKKRLKMAAEALLKVAAERAAINAPLLKCEPGTYDEFCARFAYTETDDQLQAIEDVRRDLQSGQAMDRLICGDVGFGKTEVAMRAAFIAAASGYQVAIIAPTTLLARQHYHTFSQRFEGLPFTVRMLSRLTSSQEATDTKKRLPEGTVDIVIGTHALLAAGIQFKHLGLLIVDEEQHFGVAQKEKLKQLKADVHVLTLSATPIPRTLQMSLAGVRELSLITTPPIDRLAVRTYIMPRDPVILREAILREHHRGGKTFYVTPRVKYMAELEAELRELVPEIKLTSAHGKMAATQLDTTMNAFYDGKYDLLLSTAIIESGIDIPTANTMIIDRPHLFGLAQLYQLRGRVGRSKTRAYAYFTLPHHKLLSRDAQRRLEVMQQLDSLGAGFALASHDMDIRGFGNLLGEEQSGHIKEVGIELYQAMLEEAITDLKRRRHSSDSADSSEGWSPQINLGMSVLIPESYIEYLALRLSLYRRAAGLETQPDIESFAAELVDRFGSLPKEVEHLLAVLGIKILCKHAHIARLDVGPKGAVIAFKNNQFQAPEALLAHLNKQSHRMKLRADQTLFVAQETMPDTGRIDHARALAAEIAALLPQPTPKAA